jgi:tetratricopeptide (TPR) repeat protein
LTVWVVYMNDKESLALAHDLFEQAYESQMSGELETAAELYQQSVEAYPTAEAHTYLGWAYSYLGRLDEAIEECKKAIRIDPEFGNPYNDIGSYLIQKSEFQEAIPWLLKAASARRYENHHYAHFNLGRAYIALDLLNNAREQFEQALRLEHGYEVARSALQNLKLHIH